MIRLLTFFFWIVIVASTLTALLAMSSETRVDAFGWRFETPTGVAFFVVAAFTTVVVLFASFIKDLANAPKRAQARAEVKRRDRGLAALTQGFNAVAAGDAAQARKQSQVALKALGDAPSAKLLAASSARLSGDETGAEAALAALVETPETELLALKALYLQATLAGDTDAARRRADRAFAAHPSARWAFEAAVDAALRSNDFAAAGAAFGRAKTALLVDAATARRAQAMAKTAEAFMAMKNNDAAKALALAGEALKLDAALAPAAILAARLKAGGGDARKAAATLETSFAATGDSAVADAFEELVAAEPAAMQGDRLDAFAALNPAAPAAPAMRARAALLRGDAAGTMAILEGALSTSASAELLTLMAQATAARFGEAAAHAWLMRAARARRGAAARADDYFRQGAADFARLVRAARDGAPITPTASAPKGLAADEIARLAAPPRIEPLAPPHIAAPAEASDEDDPDTDEIMNREAAAARGVS